MSDKFNSYRYKTQPYEHQKKVLKDSWAELYYAYLLEMGTGKSKCAIDNIGMLYEDNKINAVLIIAPKGSNGQLVKRRDTCSFAGSNTAYSVWVDTLFLQKVC